MAAADVRVIWRLLRGLPRRGPHARRLEAFYGPQAERYDAFRERLLHGRKALLDLLAPAPGAVVVELGAGTGRTAELFGERLPTLTRLELVDLCPSLLRQACRRARSHPNVQVVEADATCYRPAEPVDCVYFSYSLSMIPQWRAALANAHSMLRPGGLLGCVDFHVARAAPPAGWARHGPLARRLWPLWFAHDGVHLDPERLPTLVQSCETVHRSEHLAPLPYLPGLRVPYFVFVGRRAG